MTEIQIQFKYNETIRSAIINEPITYEELEYEIKNEIPKIRDIEFGLMYENHDGDYVVLNKDPRCLRLAITSSSVVPGTDLKRLKLLIFVGHSPSRRKERDLDSPIAIKSPLKKRVCPDPKTATISETRSSKKCLSFVSRMGKTRNDDDQHFKQSASTTSRCSENEPSDTDTDSHISTPFERYVEKLEDQIRLKDNEIYGLDEKLSAFQQRINLVKSQQGDGNVCHNCHLRLNHTARKCMFDSCTTLFQCGEERFHPTENVAKQYTVSLSKLRNEKEQMRKDLESKISASKKVTTSIHNRIENELLQENNEAYYESGVKNWTLVRKHVYALQCYSQKYLNGKIPPKHELLETLEEALEEFSPVERMKSLVHQAKPRKKREFASKSLLEGYGVEFPVGPRPKDSISRSDCNASNYSRDYSRLIPENEAEEEAQFG